MIEKRVKINLEQYSDETVTKERSYGGDGDSLFHPTTGLFIIIHCGLTKFWDFLQTDATVSEQNMLNSASLF